MYPSFRLVAIFVIINVMLVLDFFLRWLVAAPLLTRVASAKSQPPLRLNSDNQFHITIFSDLHFGEEEDGWGIDQDIGSTRVMNNVLDYEDPDFVIISMSLYRVGGN
jgi:hypothetical protein